MRVYQSFIRVLLTAVWMCGGSAPAQESGVPVPQGKIDALKAALSAHKDESSAARKRLTVKHMIRDGGKLLEANPRAPNRFEILGLVFSAQQQLFGMVNSARNRDTRLETCKDLAKAPNE
ncbi:MAG: hypothetical protein ACI8XO_000785 [Verrucomicrobiales bacterium]|jgi:hypothetical protein